VSDWVLSTEESGYTRHFAAEALPVSIGGAPGDDLHLAGVSGSVHVGRLDGVFFVQPGKHTENARIDGEPLRGSRRLHDGNVIALDSARLSCRLTGRRLELSIEARITAGDTAPPDLDALARGGSAEVAITPVAFQPAARAGGTGRKRGLSKTAVVIGAAFTVLAVFGWFAFTAKSVQFVFEPAVEEFSLPETVFQLRLGDRYLLRSGQHAVTARLSGYFPLDTTVDVGASPAQTIRLPLTKLPGLISLGTDPEVGADVRLDGTLLGKTPLVDVEIPPGTHQIGFTAPRHLAELRELIVAGGHERQTLGVRLTPNWAPVLLTSDPPGASVVVDGQTLGVTPIELELTAGERDVEVLLGGHNAWRDRIVVVANTPQQLPAVRLTPADGRVRLASLPSDAAVSVDGEFRGETPLTLRLTPGRTHAITLTKPGYETARRELSVAADSGRELEIELVAQYGEVDVQTSPPNAEIWVADRLVGTTPNRLNLLAVNHDIEVRLAGHAAQRASITPRPGFAQALMFELEPLDDSTGGGYPRTIMTSLDQELRLVPAGRFKMGSSRGEQGRRSNEVLGDVELSRAFYLGIREVSNAEFRAYEAERDHDSGDFGGLSLNDDEQPVVGVDWAQVARFLNWLSIRDSLQPVYMATFDTWAPARPLRNGYRLPTEAEWEWAARAAGREAPVIYPWGNELPPPDRSGNFADLAAAEILPTTLVTYHDGFPVSAPSGSFAANPVGIFDLGGNVAEWVQDFYVIDVTAPEGVVIDPLGPEGGRFHVIRGPSWRSATTTDLRLAYRDYSPEGREYVGFRIARNLE
jgi:formylglycine-generating enzyme required for sulfatase activity